MLGVARQYSHYIQLLFSILGVIVLVCDRGIEMFDHPVHVEEQVALAYITKM